MSTNIELAKTRDFGEIISDTFLFIKENLGPLLKCFFIFCGFFIIAVIITSSMEQIKLFGVGKFDGSTINTNDYSSASSPFGRLSNIFGFSYFLALFFTFLNLAAITVTVLSYMAVYKSKGNIPATPPEVWAYVKHYYFRTFGSMIVLIILLVVGTVCCLIPGIYLYPILSLIFPIMIFENTTFGYAFSQSFRIIKDNWWATFGALIVIGIVLYVLLIVIVMPISLITLGTMFLRPAAGVHVAPTLLIITTAASSIAHVLYILPLVTLALCYFNLTEQKDSTGLMDRINQLGNNDASTDLPAEEY